MYVVLIKFGGLVAGAICMATGYIQLLYRKALLVRRKTLPESPNLQAKTMSPKSQTLDHINPEV